MVLGAAALGLFAWLVYMYWSSELNVSVGKVIIFLALLTMGVLFLLFKWLNPEKAARGYLRKALIAVTGFVVTNIHLSIFDRMFLSRGKLDRLLKLK